MGDVKAVAMQWITGASVPRSIRWQQEMIRGIRSQYFGTPAQFCDCGQGRVVQFDLASTSVALCGLACDSKPSIIKVDRAEAESLELRCVWKNRAQH
jgi:hypothetical protein